jgi:hypothetical protein
VLAMTTCFDTGQAKAVAILSASSVTTRYLSFSIVQILLIIINFSVILYCWINLTETEKWLYLSQLWINLHSESSPSDLLPSVFLQRRITGVQPIKHELDRECFLRIRHLPSSSSLTWMPSRGPKRGDHQQQRAPKC